MRYGECTQCGTRWADSLTLMYPPIEEAIEAHWQAEGHQAFRIVILFPPRELRAT